MKIEYKTREIKDTQVYNEWRRHLVLSSTGLLDLPVFTVTNCHVVANRIELQFKKFNNRILIYSFDAMMRMKKFQVESLQDKLLILVT